MPPNHISAHYLADVQLMFNCPGEQDNALQVFFWYCLVGYENMEFLSMCGREWNERIKTKNGEKKMQRQ